MNNLKPVFALAAILYLAGHVPDPALLAAGGSTNVTVEVLIFSGRPNPTFPLQDLKPLKTLKVKMKDLPESFKEEPAEWSRLGFAGFRIRGGEALGLPGEIRIYQGVAKMGNEKGARFLKDSTGLERSLINEIKKQELEPPVKDAIAQYEKARKAAP